jgi:ABC-type transport system involved in cytochrome bd biosynthesis fused ATPase/permease subunit
MDYFDKVVVDNLRTHPRKEIQEAAKRYSDEQLSAIYKDFELSELFGNNDEHLAEWLNNAN